MYVACLSICAWRLRLGNNMSAAELNEYTLERVKTNTYAYQQLLRTAPVAGEDATAIELACDRLRSYLDLQLQRLHDWVEGPVDCSRL